MRVKNGVLVLLLIGILTCAIMTGCGSNTAKTEGESISENETEASSKSKAIELKVWSQKENFEVMEKMIASFKEEYSNEAEFDIKLVNKSDGNSKNDVLGDIYGAADIFVIADDQILSLIAAGALSPVPDAEEVKSANSDEAVTAASYKDTLYAYPYASDNGYFLYYNKKYLKASDVETLDKILSVAKKNGKKFAMEISSGWYLYSFFGNSGLSFGINDDGVTNYCTWNRKNSDITGVDITQALLNITSNLAFMNDKDDNFIKNVKLGKVIAGVSGIWNSVDIEKIWGKDFGACKLPTYTCAGQQVQMSSFTGYKMLAVNAYSENEAWAHKLANWLTNEENQRLRLEERNQSPSNKNVSLSDDIKKSPAVHAVLEQAQYGCLQCIGNKYWNACSDFASTILAGNPSNKPLQEIIDLLVENITAPVA